MKMLEVAFRSWSQGLKVTIIDKISGGVIRIMQNNWNRQSYNFSVNIQIIPLILQRQI